MGIGQGKGISYQTVAEKSTLSEVSSELFEMGIEGASYQTVAEKSTLSEISSELFEMGIGRGNKLSNSC